MARYIIRRLGFMALTMLLVSIAVFLISEVAPGDVARHILGQFATPEQIELLRDQMGLDQPAPVRYLDWLIGNDWRLTKLVGMPLVRITPEGKDPTWWAQAPDGTLKRWRMRKEGLAEISLLPDGTQEEVPFDNWQMDENGDEIFWGVDAAEHVVLWKKDAVQDIAAASAGRAATEASGQDYYPLKKGLLRGDPGISVRTNKPVGPTLMRRLRNSFTLAGIAFAFIMPIALVLGIVAGLNEGRPLDRGVSLFSLITTSIPEFASGVFLILIFAFWLKLLPGASVYTTDVAPWREPKLLVLPVLTLTLVEVGYVARMTRASMIEVTNAPYIRTAHLKGLPRSRIIMHHAIRNALIAPITVIMLHVNWLIGGIVVVESVFGYPGLGMYLLDSALFKDVNAIQAGALVMVALAVSTQLIADVIYTFLNPRIRYT
ncbi:MAG: ABC transporter permease [Anaerolineaceae bacterium]|jgi:peptide/nickel transport system permease protein|nr:ABC transporter permease [Anaerolineae bacterium]MDX9829860.1 ABC transporter permease [Anaerolineae bacterium]NLF11520.1 ABC transporter permease [Anaerolineaceae bacterium]